MAFLTSHILNQLDEDVDQDVFDDPPDDLSPDAPPHPGLHESRQEEVPWADGDELPWADHVHKGHHEATRFHEASRSVEAVPPQLPMPPLAPEEPIAPPPPEFRVESDIMPGWPWWLVEGLETHHEKSRQVVNEELHEGRGGSYGGAYEKGQRSEEERESFNGDEKPAGSCASGKVTKWPLLCACCFLLLFLLPVIVGLVGLPFMGISKLNLTIETTFDAFLQTDVPAAVALQSFEIALADRPAPDSRRLQSSGAAAGGHEARIAHEGPAVTASSSKRALQETSASGAPYVTPRDIVLYYEVEDALGFEGGSLTQNRIGAIARFELIMRALPKWKELCSRVEAGSAGLCEPGVSLANYGRATWGRVTEDDIQPNAFRFDGRGRNPLNMPSALYLGDVQSLSSVFLPTGVEPLPGSPSGTGQLEAPLETWQVPDVQMLRSAFRFKFFCCNQDSSSLEERRAFNERIDDEWSIFLQEDLIPLARDWRDHGLRVYLDGTGVSTAEVKLALWGDIWLAAGSIIFVHVYILVHTCSFFLSVVGPLLAAFALPLAFVVCGFAFETTTVSFASALALFLTVGFGADVILVYTDFWRASARRRAREADRLTWTYRHAGGASFATTATTALSFFANLASAIQALRQFAFLMGLCVVFAWILISLVYTPLCVWNERMSKRLCKKGRSSRLATEEAFNTKVLTKVVVFIHKSRLCIIALSMVALALFIGLSIPNVEMGNSLPSVFPEDHNRAKVEAAMTNFEPVSQVFPADFQVPTFEKDVCKMTAAPSGVTGPSCGLNWCVAAQSTEGGTAEGRCSCWRKHDDAGVCGERSWIRGVTRIVGAGTLTGQQIQQVTADRLQFDGLLPSVLTTPTLTGTNSLSPLLMQDWLTGDVELMPFTEAWGRYRLENTQGICNDFQDICFCSNSTYVCEFSPTVGRGWSKVDDFVLSTEARRARLRQLTVVPATVPASEQTRVRVGWGLWVRDTSPLIGDRSAANSWGYVDTFRPENPWTQRTMFRFCDELPAALLVTQKWCWMEDFRTWLTETKEQVWPTLNFHPLALEFADTTFPLFGTSGRKYLWVDSGAIRAFYNAFMIDVPKDTTSTLALENKADWDSYVNYFSAESQDLADSEGSGELGVFHVSLLWAEAEQESELIRSTLVTITIVMVLAFLGMLIFTRSLVLSSYVVLATIQVMAGLIFFITVIMQWQVGLIEVIAIIYFVGYAVTYPLHVAHKYADTEALQMTAPIDLDESNRTRYMRTKWALRSIGGAALGSAMTTTGASLFLVFCCLTVFRKLGAMCLAVTVLSILTALGPLPALLLMCGPPRPGVCSHGK